jgi:radical SAM superfamily enzyme YgiQ (UPF0313 family)
VLLVQAPVDGCEPLVYPVGLACLVPTLGAHQVRTLDTNTTPHHSADLMDELRRFRPEVVGISLRNMDSPNGRRPVSYYGSFKQLVRLVRDHSEATIIVGGAAFSLFAEPIMADEPAIDLGVFLDGETTFAALLDHLDDPASVPSVFFRRGGRVEFSGRAEAPAAPGRPDMTAFPVADYAAVITPEALGVESKRGCALGCVYCPYGFLGGRHFRLKDPAQVADEVLALADSGAVRFTFIDAVFNLPRDHADAVCDALIARGNCLPWSAWFNEAAIDGPFLDRAQAAGCRTLILSPDGFSDAVLQRLGKSQTIADVLRVYDLVRERPGLRVSYSFFRNPPGQTAAAFLRLAWFCLRARRQLGGRVSFFFSRLRIEPHTAVCELALREGLIRSEADLLEPVFYSPAGTAWLDRVFAFALRLRGGA